MSFKDRKDQNQCDGCRQKDVPDERGFHRDASGRSYMVCQASKYRTASAKNSKEQLDNEADGK